MTMRTTTNAHPLETTLATQPHGWRSVLLAPDTALRSYGLPAEHDVI
jgi:hypothetical protein